MQLRTEMGVSNWLNLLRKTEYGFELSKEKFWESISLRYDWKISNLPSTYPRGSRVFVTVKHSNLNDLVSKILSGICSDTGIEPKVVPLSGQHLINRSVNQSNEARFDI